MPVVLRIVTACVLGVAGAALWAWGLAGFQPAVEPGGPLTDEVFTLRDLRWTAILLAVGAVVLLGLGSRHNMVTGTLGAVGWWVADIWLDRADVAGRESAVLLGLAAVGLLAGLGILGHRTAARSGRAGLVVVGSAATSLAFLPGTALGAGDVPGALRLVLAILLTVLGTGCALAATDHPGRRRLLAAVGLVVLPSAAAMAFEPGIGVLGMVQTAVAMVGVAVVSRWRTAHESSMTSFAVHGGIALTTYYPALGLLYLVSAQVSELAAELANIPGFAMDENSSLVPLGLGYGVGCGVLALLLTRPARDDGSWELTPRNELPQEVTRS
ncbi:hypothetical protein AB0M43_34090 [Longispora sp. NPDC051575]|uniref:hypothetical protein n=1 Tax=Longispora sp. NPDC051575 TaxID=3154943 RepID=UPI0034237B15